MTVHHTRATMTHERRLYPRVKAPQHALVAVPSDSPSLPYNMNDISEGGLSFTYIASNPMPFSESQLDIYLYEELEIGVLPVTVVDDQELEGYFIPKRRCSLRFGQVSDAQRLALHRFITRYAPQRRADF